MPNHRIPATLAALLTGLVLLLAAASRQLVHCTSGDGSTRIELQREAQGCHGPHGCRHEHGHAASPAAHHAADDAADQVSDQRDCGHRHDTDHGDDEQPTADCGGGCAHLALTIDLANGPRSELLLPAPPAAATAPPAPPTFAAPSSRAGERTAPPTGPPRPPGWLVHRATTVLQV